MVGKNMLLVPEVENFLEKYKEEIAHEFGIYHTTAELDNSMSMTESLLKKKKSEEDC